MQEQKIKPILSLILSSEYEVVRYGLYRDGMPLEIGQEHKLMASKNLMLLLNNLLTRNAVTWDDLSFIGVNQGPSPFTTLRVVITTVNGLLFSLGTPIIGIDGLHTFVESIASDRVVIALLNAFNHDVYYAIKDLDGTITTGWNFHATFLQEAAGRYKTQPVLFVGNAVTGYREIIANLFSDVVIPEAIPAMVSLDAIAHVAHERFAEGKVQHEPLLPMYLKTLNYKEST